MASAARNFNIAEQENPVSFSKQKLAPNKHTTINKKGLSMKPVNQMGKTPRKALGDVKNIEGANSQSQFKKAINNDENPLKPTAKSIRSKRDESVKERLKLGLNARSENKQIFRQPAAANVSMLDNLKDKMIMDEDLDEIEKRASYDPPFVDRFEDVLGPVEERVSSLPLHQILNIPSDDTFYEPLDFDAMMKEIEEVAKVHFGDGDLL